MTKRFLANLLRTIRRTGLVSGVIAALLVLAGVAIAARVASVPAGHTAAEPTTPPPPTIIDHPADPTTQTRARFKYRDEQNTIKFKCRLDDGGYEHCGSAVNYHGLAPGHHTFCVRAVDKAGISSPESCVSWRVDDPENPAALPFTISGRGADPLYPDSRLVPVDLVLANPNVSPITVTSVTVTITGTSAGGCDAGNFAVAQQLTAQPVIPAHSTMALSALGVPSASWPQLQMLDRGNQDACQGASVQLAFSGNAEG